MQIKSLCAKGSLLLFAAVFFSLAAFPQSSPLRKGYAFAKKANYGMEMKDLDGNTVKRPDSLYFLYLETKGKEKPRLTSITFN